MTLWQWLSLFRVTVKCVKQNCELNNKIHAMLLLQMCLNTPYISSAPISNQFCGTFFVCSSLWQLQVKLWPLYQNWEQATWNQMLSVMTTSIFTYEYSCLLSFGAVGQYFEYYQMWNYELNNKPGTLPLQKMSLNTPCLSCSPTSNSWKYFKCTAQSKIF